MQSIQNYFLALPSENPDIKARVYLSSPDKYSTKLGFVGGIDSLYYILRSDQSNFYY